jgi:hypothetical protein
MMNGLRRAFIGKRTRTVLAEEFGWQVPSFTVPSDWDGHADNEWDLAIAYVVEAHRRWLDQAERGKCRVSWADVMPLLRCQMKTIAISKHALRGVDGHDLVAAWWQIQARTEGQLRGGDDPNAQPGELIRDYVRGLLR